jgi:hypothetical protein
MSRLLLALLVAGASVLQSGCTTLADARMARGTGESRIYDTPPATIWNALPGVLKELGLDHVGDNRQEGYLLAQRGISLFSYGENVAIFVDELARAGRTRVEVVSKKAMETNIFAPNWAIDILNALAQRLAKDAPAAAMPVAAAAGVAAVGIDNVDAVPMLDDRGRKGYRDWLTKRTPRAFALADGGRWFATWGFNPEDKTEPRDPSERALARCRKRNLNNCRLYAVDDRVVWNWE